MKILFESLTEIDAHDESLTMFHFENLKKPICVLFLLTFIIRFEAAMTVNRGSLSADPDGYAALAQNMRTYGVFGAGETPTAFRPPLYPALLRAFYVFTPASADKGDSRPFYLLSQQDATALLHWILGLMTVMIVYRLALILNFSRGWAFVAAVLGGIGSLPGAVVGGLILGVIEAFVSGFLSSTFRDAAAFAILILVLLFRPSGIFGRDAQEKV